MDDMISAPLGDHTYNFKPLTQGQVLAIVLSQSVGGSSSVAVIGEVLRAASPEGQWKLFISRLAVGEHTDKDLVTLVNTLLAGDAGDE